MWNWAAEEIFGWTAQEVLGEPLPFHPAELREQGMEYQQRVMYDETFPARSIPGMEVHRQRKDGSPIDIAAWTGLLRDANGEVSGVIGHMADITERKQMQQTLLQQTQELAVAEERNRLARELHDTLAQGLTAIIWPLNAAERAVQSGGEPALQSLEGIRTLARDCLQEVRRSVADLRAGPLQDHTLADALQQETQKVGMNGQVQVSFSVSGEEKLLPAGIEAAILRICQEALTNIFKYADATQATVTLAFDDSFIRLRVQDNGVGFDPETPRQGITEKGGFGLINMSERARLCGGALTVESEPRRGTMVEAVLPLHGPLGGKPHFPASP